MGALSISAKHIRKQRRIDRRYAKGMRRDLESWYQNPFLKELIAPTHESNIVAQQTESLAAATEATKRDINQTAASQGLGKAFVAKQKFMADAGQSAGVSAIRGQQAERRLGVGAQREEAYAKGKQAIKDFRHSSKSSLNR